MQCRLWPRNDAERQLAAEKHIDIERVWGINDLVQGDEAFFAATGITDGELLDGVHYGANGATTHSLVMRARSGTVRYIQSTHRLEKLETLELIPFD
jgi:fructose-1,6-bisphosphatase II